jgi:hypothetical protein
MHDLHWNRIVLRKLGDILDHLGPGVLGGVDLGLCVEDL